MSSKQVWILFLVIFATVTLGYVGHALYRIYVYQSLQKHPPVTRIQWSIQELSDERFILNADYTFEVRGRTYTGKTAFRDKVYRNAWAAGQALAIYQTESWKVWYDPTNPRLSSLQKQFPYKECAYALILAALMVYFSGLYLRYSQMGRGLPPRAME
jgi:hypothetical protein